MQLQSYKLCPKNLKLKINKRENHTNIQGYTVGRVVVELVSGRHTHPHAN